VENKEEKKGVIEWRRWQRQYRYQYRAPTPPPQNPSTCEEKLAVAAYRAANLMNSEGWSAWRQNGGAKQFQQAMNEAIAPKKVCWRKHIRGGRRKRTELRIAVLKRNAAIAAARQRAARAAAAAAAEIEVNPDHDTETGQQQQQAEEAISTVTSAATVTSTVTSIVTSTAAMAAAAVAVANMTLGKTPAAADEFENDTSDMDQRPAQVASPNNWSGDSTPTKKQGVELTAPMKRRLEVMMKIRKRIRDSFNPARKLFPEEEEESEAGEEAPAPAAASSLDTRIETMRPVLEAIDYEKTYNERMGERKGPQTPPRPDNEDAASTPDLIRLTPVIKPMPLMENALWRRRMKAMEDKKMSMSTNENRAKALKCVWEAETQLEMAMEYLLHITFLKRRMEVLGVIKALDKVKSGLEDDTLEISEDEEDEGELIIVE